MQRAEEWHEARAEAASLQEQADLRAAAEAYVKTWPKHPPNAFQSDFRTRQRKARARAWKNGDGWASRLVMLTPELAHFSLHAEHLGLEPTCAEAHGIFNRATIRRWKRAIRKHFSKPLHWHLEVGEEGRLHLHIIGDVNDGPKHLQRGREVIKPIRSQRHLENVVAYAYKPAMSYTAENLFVFWRVKRSLKRLPNTSGTMHFPRQLEVVPRVPPCKVHFQPSESEPEQTSQEPSRAPVRRAVPCLKSSPQSRPRQGRKLLSTRARAPPLSLAGHPL